MRDTRAEALVVGGGVIGLAVAFELSRRGLEVLVVERGRPGDGATAAAAGMLAPISEAGLDDPDLVHLGRDSLRRYPEFVAEIERVSGRSCDYRREGTLWVAACQDDREELGHLEATLREKGLPVEALPAHELLRREPRLSGRVLGGLWLAHEQQVDPRALAAALAEALSRRGGRILAGAAVRRIERGPGRAWRVHGRLSDGEAFELQAERLILAAGAWAGRDIEHPLGELGLRPVKGQLLRLRGPALLEHVVRTPDVYLVPRRDGELLVGATMEEAGFDLAPTAGAAMDLLRHAWRALPGIYELELCEISVGLRPAFDDHRPLLGRSEHEGLFLALGHFRHGVLLAPATANYLAESVLGASEPEPLAPFGWARRAAAAALVRGTGG